MAAPANTPGHRSRRKGPQPAADGKRWLPRTPSGQREPEKKANRSKKPSRQVRARQVSLELVKLRPILKDIATALLDRLDGGLAVLSRKLVGQALSDDPPKLPRVPTLSGMLADIQAIKVKPKKGRVKDLGRIEILLESLSRRMPPEA